MTKNFTGKLILCLCLFAFALSCSQPERNKNVAMNTHDTVYTCPMHTHIREEKKGKCPICGMDLVLLHESHGISQDSSVKPLLEDNSATIGGSAEVIEADSGTRIIAQPIQGIVSYDNRQRKTISTRVSGRIEKLNIKYNFQPIRKGDLIMQIYSQDLVTAQREMIYLQSSGNADLLQKAKLKLQLLGMSATQISSVLSRKTPDYAVSVYSSYSGYILESTQDNTANFSAPAPSAAGTGMDEMAGPGSTPVNIPTAPLNSPVLLREGQYVQAGQPVFNIYEDNALTAEFSLPVSIGNQVSKRQSFVFRSIADETNVFRGTIGLVQPKYLQGQNFTVIRVYLQTSELRPGQLLSGNIPLVLKGWWLPAKAVLATGNRHIVFRKDGEDFNPVALKTGFTDGEWIQVLDDVSGWKLAANAGLLEDSDKIIKTENKGITK